jgi:phytoene dehydrogenase-like protein
MSRHIDDYDVIVLGSGPGGLIAGALLARKNHSVLLLRERGYQTSYDRAGYRFSPFSNFSEMRLRPSLVQKVSRELGLPFQDGNSEEDSSVREDHGKSQRKVPFQVILPKARIDLFDEPSLLQMEWKREFRDELAQIGAFYEELELIQGLLRTEKNRDTSAFFPIKRRAFIQKWLSFLSTNYGTNKRLNSLSKEFKEFVHLQLISLGNFFSDTFPVPLTAHLLLHEERGEWVSHMDLDGLEERLFDSFLRSEGEIEEIEKAERIEKGWKKGFTLSVEGDRRVFQSKFLILNSPLHFFSDILGNEKKSVSKWLMKIQPKYLLFPCFFGISEKVVPVGMGDLLVSMLDFGKPYEEGNVLFLSLSPKGDETAAPDGRRALTVQSLIPFGSWSQAALTSHQESVMSHLNHLIPFLDRYLEFTDFEWAHEQLGRWSYPHFLYETTRAFNWREGVIPTELSNDLYFTGKENFPYLGLEGEVLSGLMAAEQILKKSA